MQQVRAVAEASSRLLGRALRGWWPLPALLCWAACWLCFSQLRSALGVPLAWSVSFGLALLLSLLQRRPWRRLIVAGGFVLSGLALGLGAGVPAWVWLFPLLFLLLLYPRRTWRDAPLFPTPRHALSAVPELLALRPGARILDAGCGLGAGLRELHRQFPHAQLHGVEWSPLLARLCAWRCPFAKVRRGDMWQGNWRDFEMVYLFQRPESMAQAQRKAAIEMRPGSWLLSLDFPMPARAALHELPLQGRHRLYVYRY